MSWPTLPLGFVAGGVTVQLPFPSGVVDSGTTQRTYSATITLFNDGSAETDTGGSSPTELDWYIPNPVSTSITSQYEVLFEEVSFETPTNTGSVTITQVGNSYFGNWVPLNVDRVVGLETVGTVPLAAALSSTWSITMSIRKVGGPTIDTAGCLLVLNKT